MLCRNGVSTMMAAASPSDYRPRLADWVARSKARSDSKKKRERERERKKARKQLVELSVEKREQTMIKTPSFDGKWKSGKNFVYTKFRLVRNTKKKYEAKSLVTSYNYISLSYHLEDSGNVCLTFDQPCKCDLPPRIDTRFPRSRGNNWFSIPIATIPTKRTFQIESKPYLNFYMLNLYSTNFYIKISLS